jgi:hypothetical protein
MKRWFLGVASAILITLGFVGTAFASTDLELISDSGHTLLVGTSTLGVLWCDGAAANCAGSGFSASGGAVTGGYSISAGTFDGWSVTISDLGSNTPGCPPAGPGGPGCLNSTNITANASGPGTHKLGAFDFSSGFVTPYGFIVANTSALQTGSNESQQAYATTLGVDPLVGSPTTFAAAVAGQVPCGLLLSSGPPGVSAVPTTCANPGNPVSLELATIFTTTVAGGFNVGGNISSVPEPAAVALFGTVLALCASGLRRRRKLS